MTGMDDIIRLQDMTSSDKVSGLVSRYRSQVLDGERNPLEVAIILKALEDFTKKLRSDLMIKDATLAELQKYPEKAIVFMGADFTKKVVRTVYDYTRCNDPMLRKLERKAEMAEAELKLRQKFLQGLPKEGLETFDADTGEVYTLLPPAKQQEEGFSVSLGAARKAKPRYDTTDFNDVEYSDADPGL